MLSCPFWDKTLSDPGVFWVMATAVITIAIVAVTAVLALLAWKQLRDLARTSRADFIFRLKNDFFTADSRQLLFLAEENFLRFEDAKIPYFAINKPDDSTVNPRFTELGITEATVSTYVDDDVLLGPLEDVGLFLRQDLITVGQTREMFYSYAEICAENAAIRQYIKWNRQKPGKSGIYSNFDYLCACLGLALIPRAEVPTMPPARTAPA